MYTDTGLTLTPPEVSGLLGRADLLVVPPGTTGSWMSPHPATTELLQDYIRRQVRDLPRPPWIYCTIVHLFPSQQLVAHRDAPIGGGVRYHIPLRVNPGCWVFHAGAWQQLAVGHVYQMDPTQVHGAVNWGHDLRRHLILDWEERPL